MKRILILLSALLVLGSCNKSTNPDPATNAEDFGMILRLWPAHHTDEQLRDDLIEALKKYNGTFNEVWFCQEFETLSMDTHRESAAKMAVANDMLREIGVTTSIQGISVGHGDDFEAGADELRPTKWTTIVDAFGNRTQMSHCPRQSAFLDYMSEMYATYAKVCQPRISWIDDDLRVTRHHPARMLCFCDTCISEFNKQYGYNFTNRELEAALDANEGGGTLRKQWIEFSQQSLALVAEATAKGVHSVSPNTKVGIQQVNFHRELLEGRDWNQSYAAIERTTGLDATSRPGNGFYDDDAPHGMIGKALDMARQIRRLSPSVKEIVAEVEGYRHYATGKSPQGLCTESMLYLAMGVTQLSYAIICSASEPMEWYADNYFKFLQRWRPLYEEYAAFNRGTEPGGANPYISPDHVTINAPGWGWLMTSAGDVASAISTLGVPLCPDGNYPAVQLIDGPSAAGIPNDEALQLLASNHLVLDHAAWNIITSVDGWDKAIKQVDAPEVTLEGAVCFEGANGGRTVVIPGYTTNISNAERLAMARAIDWASENKMPVIMESMAQAVIVPRINAEGALRSVAVLNTTISEQPTTTLRLRGCADAKRLVWHSAEERDQKLNFKRDGNDIIVTIPTQPGWYMGWLSIE
ncbi:MAG: hypothetical protein IKY82_05905 [Alistipes sp.]|nr:hypothetical protein [Alistipes sp.]